MRIASWIADCSGGYGEPSARVWCATACMLPADQLRRRVVAEQPRARRIAERALAIQIDAVDRFGGRIEQQANLLFTRRDLVARDDELG